MSSSSTISIRKNYSTELEQYRQSGDICAFLNVNWVHLLENSQLAERFAAFEAAGFHLPSTNNGSLLESLVPYSILRQFTVSQCAFKEWLDFRNQPPNPVVESIEIQEGGYGYRFTSQIVLPSSVAMLTVLFNISLLIVTARKISMSTVCNWLIAFDSFCQIPVMVPYLINLFAYCAQIDTVDHRICLVSQMLSIGSSYASFLAVFFMSLERLLIVTMPMRMSQMSEKKIIQCSLLAVLVCTSFGVAMILIIFKIQTLINYILQNFIHCNTSLLAEIMSKGNYVSHTILSLSMVNYVLIAGLIAWRRIYVPSTQTDTNNNAAYSRATYRMLRSVFIIFIVFLIGWLFGFVLTTQITNPFADMLADKIAHALLPAAADWEQGDSPGFILTIKLERWLGGLVDCLFPVAAGINAPVMIINNSDYRAAYKKTVAPLLICRKRNTATAVVGPLFINYHHHNHQ